MRGLLILGSLLSGFTLFSDARAQESQLGYYVFPREVQAILASPDFLERISVTRQFAEIQDRQLEIRHLNTRVENYTTIVEFILSSTDPQASKKTLLRLPMARLSYILPSNPGSTAVAVSRFERIHTLPTDQKPFPSEWSAAIIHPEFANTIHRLRRDLEEHVGSTEVKPAELCIMGVTSGRLFYNERGVQLLFHVGIPNISVVTEISPYSTIAVDVVRLAESGSSEAFPLATSVMERPYDPKWWKSAILRQAKPKTLPNAPRAERAFAPKPDVKPTDVDLAKETKKSAREGKARREGKGRGGRK